MTAIQTRSPRMGWLGVQTARDELLCWPCAAGMQHHGAMLGPEDVLANDRCDGCGVVLLTGEERPAPDIKRQTTEAQQTHTGWFYARVHDCSFEYGSKQVPRGIRLRKLRWHERLRRWLTPTE